MDKHRASDSPRPECEWAESPRPFEDDDYARFLLSLEGGQALPEDDDDDPDFIEDLKRLLEEMSDEEANEIPAAGQQADQPHLQDNWDPRQDVPVHCEMPSPLTQAMAVDDLGQLHKENETLSRYSLDGMDIEDLEGRLTPYVDYNTYDEMLEVPSNKNSVENGAAEKRSHRAKAQVTGKNIDIMKLRSKPGRRKPGPYIKRTQYEKPSIEFEDIFPHELFGSDECLNPPDSQSNSLESDLPLEMLVNTLNGPIRMRTDAWTPDMIMCLNRIMNAHTQLLIQAFAACLGMPHLHDVSDDMHTQLHSMYQMFQAQFNFDFGFDTMLKQEVPLLLPPYGRSEAPTKGKRSSSSSTKPMRRPKKRRRVKTNVEEVIDLTEEGLEDPLPVWNVLGSVMDVPLMHVLPHLWQALMVISMSKRGSLYGDDELPPEGLSKRLGYLPKLAPPKDVQRAMHYVEELMTCGVRMPVHDVDHTNSWSQTETALLMYAVQLYRENFSLIRTHYLPHKDIRTLQRVTRDSKPEFDKHWKKIQATLLDTDSVGMFAQNIPERIEQIQEQLCIVCRHFRETNEETCPNRLTVNPLPQQSATVLKLLQGIVKNSALHLVKQAFGDRHALASSSACNKSVIQNLMCVLLGQIGGQLAGSFDTLFTMMSVIAGMQLINDAELTGLDQQQPDIIEIDPNSHERNVPTNEQTRRRHVP